jgi:hypothetical protein
MAQMVEHLSSMYEAPCSIPCTEKQNTFCDLLVSASGVLGLQVFATTPQLVLLLQFVFLFVVLEFEFRALCLLCKHSTTQTTLTLFTFKLFFR